MRVHRTRLIGLALLLGVSGIGCSGMHLRGDGPRRWSADWYDAEAKRPDGARQVHSHGHDWPPYPRPCGEGAQFTARFHAAHYWPHPYNCQDLAYLRAVSATQVANGWQKGTTLYGFHFDENHMVNHAGRLQLKWILEAIPAERRTVFVQGSEEKSITEARLANVRTMATEIVGEAALPPILVRNDIPDDRPTAEVNEIRKRERAAMRPPQIPYNSSSGTSSTGGSGGTP